MSHRAVEETRLCKDTAGTSTQYRRMVGPGRAQGTVTVAVTKKVTTDTRTDAGHTVSRNIQVSMTMNAGIVWPAVTMAAGAPDAHKTVGTIDQGEAATTSSVL